MSRRRKPLGRRFKSYSGSIFAKPIENELVVELNILGMSHRNGSHLEMLWLIAKEGWQKARIGEYHSQRQALSRFSLAALIVSDPMLDVLRRELRKISPGVKVKTNELREVLLNEVIKRDALEGDKADAARKMLSRAVNKAARRREAAKESTDGESLVAPPTPSPDKPSVVQ